MIYKQSIICNIKGENVCVSVLMATLFVKSLRRFCEQPGWKSKSFRNRRKKRCVWMYTHTTFASTVYCASKVRTFWLVIANSKCGLRVKM